MPRERSIWELFAYCDPSTYVSVRIVYTLPQGKAAPDGAVRLIGNFNGWATPVQMTKADGNDLATTIKVPPEALVIFRFVVGDQDVLSDRYQKVHDNEGKPRPSALSYFANLTCAMRRGVVQRDSAKARRSVCQREAWDDEAVAGGGHRGNDHIATINWVAADASATEARREERTGQLREAEAVR